MTAWSLRRLLWAQFLYENKALHACLVAVIMCKSSSGLQSTLPHRSRTEIPQRAEQAGDRKCKFSAWSTSSTWCWLALYYGVKPWCSATSLIGRFAAATPQGAPEPSDRFLLPRDQRHNKPDGIRDFLGSRNPVRQQNAKPQVPPPGYAPRCIYAFVEIVTTTTACT
jgi:hypothetical protein